MGQVNETAQSTKDCISRQAAIDVFDCTNELIVGGAANAQNVVNYINKVVGKIKALPSAQPEVIRCKDCVNHVDDRCLAANHHTGDTEYCMEVFGAKMKGEQP